VSLNRAALHTVAGLAAVGAAGLAYASLIERNAFVLRRFSVPVLPHGAPSLRALRGRSSGSARSPPWTRTWSSTPATTSPTSRPSLPCCTR